jgi:hypothetical protein
MFACGPFKSMPASIYSLVNILKQKICPATDLPTRTRSWEPETGLAGWFPATTQKADINHADYLA